MEIKEFIKDTYSRKAGVAVLAIMALTYIARELIGQVNIAADVGTYDLTAIKWMVVFIVAAIWLIATEAIWAQWSIDHKYGKDKDEQPAEPETNQP